MTRRRQPPRKRTGAGGQPPAARAPAQARTPKPADTSAQPVRPGRISIWPLSGAGLTLVTLLVVGLVVGIVVALHSAGSSSPPPFGTPLPAP